MKKSLLKKNEKEWLGGIIDGDGSILVYSDHVSIEITTSIEDEGILLWVKKKFGGSIKPRSGSKSLRWRSRKKNVVLNLLLELHGFLLHPTRVDQFKKALNFYDICLSSYEENDLISKKSSYLSGLFDSDGSLSITTSRKQVPKLLTNISGEYGKAQRLIHSRGGNQLKIKLSSSDKDLMERIKSGMGFGEILKETENPKNKKPKLIYHWVVYNSSIFEFLDYLENNPLRGFKKKKRFHLIKKYLYLKQNKYHLSQEGGIQFKEWAKFCYKWYNIQS